ncbi:hypothetical protein [Candidatus Uabimicrobium sp. HlEnr_7]|uniref:hypothetical protein n=1 Tax=Candidatus Uabimicrobium helgolandensis TaxID=3095367 RepID=UPI0035588131
MACDDSLTLQQKTTLECHLQQCINCNTQYEWLQQHFQSDTKNNTKNNVVLIPQEGLILPCIWSPQGLAAASNDDFKDISLLDGEIVGNVAKEYDEIVYRLSTKEMKFKSIKVIIEVDNSEKKSCIFLPYGDELALFPIEKGQVSNLPIIAFPYKDNIQTDKVKLFQEL